MSRLEELKLKYPKVPGHCLPVYGRRKKQSPANKLTDQVIKEIKDRGGMAWRINNTGIYDPKLRRFRYSGTLKGIPDVIGCLDSQFISVEVKIGRDRQSGDQKKREQEVVEARGVYIIAKTYEQFVTDMAELMR